MSSNGSYTPPITIPTGGGGTSIPCISKKFRADYSDTDISVPAWSFVNLYCYYGSGLLFGFNLEFDEDDIDIKLIVDGETLFTLNLKDLESVADIGSDTICRFFRIDNDDHVEFCPPWPICYNSSVVIDAQKTKNGSRKKMKQSLVLLTKET